MSAPITRLQAYDLLDKSRLTLIQVAIVRAYIACMPSAQPVEQGESWPGLKHLCAVTRASRGKVQAERRALFANGLLIKRPRAAGAPLRCAVDVDRLQYAASARPEPALAASAEASGELAGVCHSMAGGCATDEGGMPRRGRGYATAWQGGMPQHGTEPAPYNPLQEPSMKSSDPGATTADQGAMPPAPDGATPAADAAQALVDIRAELEAERKARRQLEAQVASLMAALERQLELAQPQATEPPQAVEETPAPAPMAELPPMGQAQLLAPVAAPQPTLTLLTGGQAVAVRSRPQRPARAEVEAAVTACAATVLQRLDARRRNVFRLPGQVRETFAQASVSAMAKALLRLDSRQAGLSAAVSAAEALAVRGDLGEALVARGREIDLVHAFMLRSQANRRWMAPGRGYPHPIGQAPDFVVVLREVDANLEAAQAWDVAGRPLGHDSDSLAAWTTYLSARRMVPPSADVDARRRAMTEWADGAPDEDGAEKRMRVLQAFRKVVGTTFDPYRPSDAHEAAFVDVWFEDAADAEQAAR